jgi:hypothetical protein
MANEFLDKQTLRSVGVVVASVFMFYGLPKLQFVGPYLEKYPLVAIGISLGIIFLVFKYK